MRDRVRVPYARLLACAVIAVLVHLIGASSAAAAMAIESGPRAVVSEQQITVWWHSSSTGSSELRWDTSADSWDAMTHDESNTATTLGTLHSRTISNLRPGTYYYRVRTTGAAGTVTSGAQTFVVDALPTHMPIQTAVTNGTVNVSTPSADGSTYYLGGTFTRVGKQTGSLGTVDTTNGTLAPGQPFTNGYTYASVPDGVGGYYIGGSFSQVGGLVRSQIAHILPDGGVDPHFDIDMDNTILTMARYGSTLYVGGFFNDIDGITRNHIGAIDLTTNTVSSFNPDVDDTVYEIVPDATGARVFIGGAFLNVGATGRLRIAEVDTATSLATAWNPGADNTVRTIVLSGTTLYVGGAFTTLGSNATTVRHRLGALSTSSSAALAWNPGASAGGTGGIVYALAVSSGFVFAGGSFTMVGGGGTGATARTRLAKIDGTTGTVDAWDPGASNTVFTFLLDGTNLYVGGLFLTLGGQARPSAGMLTTTSAVPSAWSPATDESVRTMIKLGSSVVIGGDFVSANMVARTRVAAFDALTGDPTAFVANAGNTVWALAHVGSKLYIGGAFTTINSVSRPYLGAVDAATGVLDAWAPAANADVFSMQYDGTGTLFVGGNFTSLNATTRNRLASYNTGTGALNTWNPNVTGGGVYYLVADTTNVYIGGGFTTVGAATRNKLASVAISGGAATAWNPGANDYVNALSLDGTGNVYAAGNFTMIGGGGTGTTGRNYAAKINASGAVVTAWNANPNGEAIAILAHDNAVWIGGVFTTAGGQSRTNLVVTDTTNGTATTFAPNPDDEIKHLAASGSLVFVSGLMAEDSSAIDPGGFAMYDTQTRRSHTADVPTLTITNGPTYTRDAGQYTVFWETNVSSSSELVWDRQDMSAWNDYSDDASNYDTSLGTKHSRTVSNLSPGTYRFRVRSRTAAGQQITSGEYLIRIDQGTRWSPLGHAVVNGNVYDTELSADGSTLFAAGSFGSVGMRKGGGLPISTTTGIEPRGLPQIAGEVWTSIPDGSGGYYVGGSFEYVGGQRHQNLVHILPDGGVDNDFTIHVNWDVYSLVLSGSTLYVGGRFTAVGGQPRTGLAAIDVSNNTVTAWDPAPGAEVSAMAIGGTTLYVGGTFTNIASQPRTRLAAFTIATGAITSWAPAFTGTLINEMTYVGTSVIVGGEFTNLGGAARTNLGALNASGTATTFAPNPDGVVYALAARASTVVVGGDFATIGGAARSRLAELNPGVATGNPASYVINQTPNAAVRAFAITGSTLYFGGSFSRVGATTRNNLAVLDLGTNALAPLDPNIGASVRTLSLWGNQLYVGGQFTTTRATPRAGLAAFDAVTGALKGWNPAATHATQKPFVYALTRSGSTLYVGGGFGTIGGGAARVNIAALDETTGLATSWYPTSGANGTVYDLLLNGTTIYAGGAFTSIGGQPKSHVASLNASTAAVNAFTANTDGAWVYAMQIAGGKLWVGGDFTTMNGTARSGIAAVSASTGATDPWNPGTAGTVRALATDGTTVYVGGDFTTIGGQTRSKAAAITASTGAITAWAPNPSGSVYGLALNGTNVYIGGAFSSIAGGTRRLGSAAVDTTTGTTVEAFAPDTDYAIYTFAFIGTRVFIGGPFTAMGDERYPHGGLAMIDTCDRDTYCAGEAVREYTSVTLNTPTINLGSTAVLTSVTATSVLSVRSNATMGYTVVADDSDDVRSLRCTVGACAGTYVPDWTGTSATPTVWAPADTGAEYGFGVTVLSTSVGARMAKWGAGTSSATAFSTNRYAGVDDGDLVLHETERFTSTATETITLGWRLRAAPTQTIGAYEVTESIVVVPNA